VVKQEGAGAWTEAIEDIREDVRYLRRRADLDTVDREWQEERERHLVRGKHGQTSVPSQATGMGVIVAAVAFGGLLVVVAGSMSDELPFPFTVFPLFGVVFIVVGIFSGLRQISKANDLEGARQKYKQRRAELLGEE
jgi:hypothetical protein